MKKLSLISYLLVLFASSVAAQTGSLSGPSGITVGGSAINVSFDNTGQGGATNQSYNGVSGVQNMFITIDSTPIVNQPISLFCIELTDSGLDDFTFESVATNLTGRGLPWTMTNATTAASRADQLTDLFQAVFSAGYTPLTIPGYSGNFATNSDAFQLAVWSIIYGRASSITSSTTGFKVTSAANASVLSTANAMLSDASNPLLPAATFVLKALTAADGQDYVVPFLGDTPGVTTPEPSTYALLVGLATLGVVSIRRRFKVAA